MTQKSDIILERMMALHPKLIDLHLERVEQLVAAMEHPEQSLGLTVHVAGTNGKGSTVATLEAMALAQGLSVNRYTSPHLVRFHERIAHDGTPIDEAVLSAVLAACEEANQGAAITYFEITTVAAFEAFRRRPADLTLLEVGLGGRFDATNVLPPSVSVITPVAMDHQQFLGDTIEAIAGEKAGIIKPGVPVVVGPQSHAALAVIEERAEKLGAPLWVHGQDWTVWEERGRLIYQDETGLLDLPLPNLKGAHQIHNAGAAIAASRAAHLPIDETAMERGLRAIRWPGRLMPLPAHPFLKALPEGAELWLDGGHNPAAGQALAQFMAERAKHDPRPLVLIAGMLTTKDQQGFFAPFAPLAPQVLCVPIEGEPNATPPETLAQKAQAAGLDAAAVASLPDALGAIEQTAPRVLICGSLYLAGQVLRA